MPICHDPALVRPLLLTDEPGTRSIYNFIHGRAGARARWVRVDDLANPRAVIIRSGARFRNRRHYIYATSDRATETLLAEIPRDWQLMFAASPSRLVKVVRKLRKLDFVRHNYLYVLEPENLVTYRGHRVETVHPEDAPQIARLWANGRQLNYVRWRINAGPSAAIRRHGSLVAWGMTHADGSMAMLRVLEEYRGQGLARAITYALAKRVIARGLRPFLHIHRGNQASISLCESMGFTRHSACAWFGQR
jgi:ribosomal protein S18 acetylase RimI-like enzyme